MFVDQSFFFKLRNYKNYTKVSATLHGAAVYVINQEECMNQWKDTGFEVTDRMICTGSREDGRHACQGDSGEKHIRPIFLDQRYTYYMFLFYGLGGPITLLSETHDPLLIGIVSFAFQYCALTNRPNGT